MSPQSEENSPAAENQRDNLKDSAVFVKKKEGTKSLGMWVAPRYGIGKGVEFSLESSERNADLVTPWF